MGCRTPDTTYKQMERLSRDGKRRASMLGHDMGRYDRSPEYGQSSASPIHYSAIASCKRCVSQVRVLTCAAEPLTGDALAKTCQQAQMERGL